MRAEQMHWSETAGWRRGDRVNDAELVVYFGSREGLVVAVVAHSMQALHAQLIAALNGSRATDRNELMEMVAAVCSEGGLGRLLGALLNRNADNTRRQIAAPL